MDHRIFNVSTDVNACDMHTGVCADTVEESALKVDFSRRTGESNLCQRRAGPMV